MISNSSQLDGWAKSSYSGVEANACVEWAPTQAATTGAVPVRDSKDPHGPALTFEPAAWSAFITAVKAGDFTG
ncbi:DUF397 domain-containing protein [Streptomyces sp. AC536]|uniref:DUF397 domain-containing protein n=1 Tax=Streptomyces buecherae TaxID=2763006 RepID=UPI00164CE244|nr:DUF397 domain-containing protein [Streptomyces buecherae]MBC3985629.1 DUF397 domain-containing protein [Streptomyces buecherae]QNJ42394.1 DUF397 domain-containing protein [Streptomyces buecherae]